MVRGRKPPRDKGRHFRSEKDVSDDEDGSGKEDQWGPRGLTVQKRNLDLPPSDSDSEDESGSEGEQKPKEDIRIKVVPMKQQVRDKKDEASSSEEDSSSDDEVPINEYLKGPNRQQQAKKEEKQEAVISARQMKEDMSRLEAIRQKREQDRLKRIATEGWDRFAPVTETNKPPVVARNKD